MANLQCESMGETPCQQVEQLLDDDGFLMLHSVRAEALFLERTCNHCKTSRSLFALCQKHEENLFLVGACTRREGQPQWDLLGLCSVCWTSMESRGTSVRG